MAALIEETAYTIFGIVELQCAQEMLDSDGATDVH